MYVMIYYEPVIVFNTVFYTRYIIVYEYLFILFLDLRTALIFQKVILYAPSVTINYYFVNFLLIAIYTRSVYVDTLD